MEQQLYFYFLVCLLAYCVFMTHTLAKLVI